MNLAIHQKISGLEAIKIWTNGGFVYDAHGAKYAIDKEDGFLWYTSPFYRCGYDRTFNEIIKNDWYIPKPFDVRQAMLDRPNEWVAAFNLGGVWMKLGFDEEQMMAVEGPFDYEGKANMSESASVGPNWRIHLDKCIPIEDVPEEATR